MSASLIQGTEINSKNASPFLGFTGSSTATIGWDTFCFESKVTKKDKDMIRG
jgi:hypothetical protein